MNKINETKMKPKAFYAEDKITIYLCPKCNGYFIDYMQEKCEQCGVEFDWSLKDE